MSYRLRLMREDDCERVRQWRMLPEVTKYMYTDPQITPEQQRAWFERIAVSDRDRVWIIESVDDAGTPAPIGVLSLSEIDPVNQRCAWAYYLGETSARGIGLAKSLELSVYAYVFDTLGLNKLWCEVFAFNDRVVALHEKFGSKVEGIARQHIRKNGEWFDVVRMGILKSEWDATREKWTYTPIEIEHRA
ncbi:UDP-4-amino-4,6-dideoxy-N-acetyl-beta-L-altrosamine N-acetyltransferase [Aquabacterium humicola]|uniref:UDP-4-amino-4, 6-dideoxy-N-acetyl-beta-L-altrosamine N-acetyltransferase n=1 Tax=Aquabacterium humicola TaxID=3237377 RepID=UPI002542CA6D|nr:UDP-4-amino-4,6-dideoxy-N-acetyl-beta-L-altrosamine N-acetyltransferase [Rubrivivax pictus]